jgi:hypothetical protein
VDLEFLSTINVATLLINDSNPYAPPILDHLTNAARIRNAQCSMVLCRAEVISGPTMPHERQHHKIVDLEFLSTINVATLLINDSNPYAPPILGLLTNAARIRNAQCSMVLCRAEVISGPTMPHERQQPFSQHL